MELFSRSLKIIQVADIEIAIGKEKSTSYTRLNLLFFSASNANVKLIRTLKGTVMNVNFKLFKKEFWKFEFFKTD